MLSSIQIHNKIVENRAKLDAAEKSFNAAEGDAKDVFRDTINQIKGENKSLDEQLAELAANEVGLSVDLERFYSHILNGEGNFPGWLETDQALKKPEFENVKKQLEDGGGLVNSGKIRIFDHGLKYKSTPQTMVDMSLVQQEQWILQQVCRTLSVPPQEVFDLSNATYSNIEQGALNFANKTLMPECTEIENAFSNVLWSIGLKDCYVQFDMNGLFAAATATAWRATRRLFSRAG